MTELSRLLVVRLRDEIRLGRQLRIASHTVIVVGVEVGLGLSPLFKQELVSTHMLRLELAAESLLRRGRFSEPRAFQGQHSAPLSRVARERLSCEEVL